MHIDKVLTSMKTFFIKKSNEYFIVYKYDNFKINPLYITLKGLIKLTVF